MVWEDAGSDTKQHILIIGLFYRQVDWKTADANDWKNAEYPPQ